MFWNVKKLSEDDKKSKKTHAVAIGDILATFAALRPLEPSTKETVVNANVQKIWGAP